jgi:hypothetical protein
LAGSICLGFLGAWRFRCENPVFERWTSLDFLGFSRPNRDFSMGYGGFSREEISRAFRLKGVARSRGRGHADTQNFHEASLSSNFVFRQLIAVQRNIVQTISPHNPDNIATRSLQCHSARLMSRFEVRAICESATVRMNHCPHTEERGHSPARDGRSSERPMASRLEVCSRGTRLLR